MTLVNLTFEKCNWLNFPFLQSMGQLVLNSNSYGHLKQQKQLTALFQHQPMYRPKRLKKSSNPRKRLYAMQQIAPVPSLIGVKHWKVMWPFLHRKERDGKVPVKIMMTLVSYPLQQKEARRGHMKGEAVGNRLVGTALQRVHTRIGRYPMSDINNQRNMYPECWNLMILHELWVILGVYHWR